MELAKCNVKLNPGHVVQKPDITPAEAIILRSMHHVNVGGDPLEDIQVTGETQDGWNPVRERKRLVVLYGKDKVFKHFPGAVPQMPLKFAELGELEIENEGDEPNYFLESGGRMPGAPPKKGDE